MVACGLVCNELFSQKKEANQLFIVLSSCELLTFPSLKCLAALTTFKILDITWAVGHSFNLYYTWVCTGLDGSTYSESLPVGTCYFEPLEHVPRTSTWAPTCALRPDGLRACHGADNTRNDPRPEEQKVPKGQKNTFIYAWWYIYKTIGRSWVRFSSV